MPNNQLKPVDRLKSVINSPTVKEQFNNAMGKHSDLFVASLIDVFNDGLQKMDPAGVVQEALKAAVLKLPISKSLGFAYLVPYKGKVQFQIGYKGMIQLAMRSGQVKILNAGPVFEGEFRSFDRMTGLVDITGDKKNDKPEGYFVYMELINGFKKSEYWTKDRVISHAKDKSPSYKSGKSAWTTDFDAMATKTVLRSVLSKYAPMSIDFLTVMADEENPSSEPKDITDLTDQLGDDPAPETKSESEGAKPQFGQEN